MRTLALWYYYGLNVSRDREKGLEWYRKAAAAGSAAAKQELAQIETGQR
jgi:TPR repeat protein